ncbi:MAG: recombinase family protein [Solirubrobacteraceae bacterium]
MAKVIIYAAKSTADKHGSIKRQRRNCRELTEQNGWEIVHDYWDENFSAYSGNRGPYLQRALACATRPRSTCSSRL